LVIRNHGAFGLALGNVPFAFEQHYGSMLGSETMVENGLGSNESVNKTKLCSFAIAHTDEKDDLLWYNGSLLKNKATNLTEFDVPDRYMLDGDWIKGRPRPKRVA
jgi:alpha 1,3-mannosyltransferase